jgi:hypothetical protein
MKIFYGGGSEDITLEELTKRMRSEDLRIRLGKIYSLQILERKALSNKGNALDGMVKCEGDIGSVCLNIGGNPIGTGYTNYIQFLQEMNCEKIGGIYRLSSLIGKDVLYLVRNDTLRGYITPKGFMGLTDIAHLNTPQDS